jgi:hypothetical protein
MTEDSLDPILEIDKKREEIFRLMELSIDEQRFFIETHHKRISSFSTLISAVLVATIAGVFKVRIIIIISF